MSLKKAIAFTEKLRKNNNRDWFNENKPEYQERHLEVIEFADGMLEKMRKVDEIETPTGKKSLHRIYRDVRFSKNKNPYKNHWSGGFKRATKYQRGGYYFHLEKGNAIAAGGFWGPNSKDLKKIRAEIAVSGDELIEIVEAKEFKKYFGELQGDQLKVAPSGFPKDHEYIDLLRFKQYLLVRHFSDEELFSDDFDDKIVDTFRAMRPFFDYMSMALTTDANGEPLPESELD